jgi:hypothetical protein
MAATMLSRCALNSRACSRTHLRLYAMSGILGLPASGRTEAIVVCHN